MSGYFSKCYSVYQVSYNQCVGLVGTLSKVISFSQRNSKKVWKLYIFLRNLIKDRDIQAHVFLQTYGIFDMEYLKTDSNTFNFKQKVQTFLSDTSC